MKNFQHVLLSLLGFFVSLAVILFVLFVFYGWATDAEGTAGVYVREVSRADSQ